MKQRLKGTAVQTWNQGNWSMDGYSDRDEELSAPLIDLNNKIL